MTSGTLAGILDLLRSRWRLIVVCGLCFFLGAVAVIESRPPEYEASAVVAFSPRAGVPNATADTVRLLTITFVPYVTAPDTIDRAAAAAEVPVADVQAGVDATVTPDTSNLTISTRLRSPEKAAEVANEFAAAVLAFAAGHRLLEADVTRRAAPPTAPAGVSSRVVEMAALVGGLLLGILVALVVEQARPRMRSTRELVDATGYPVIGAIPTSRVLRADPKAAFTHSAVGPAIRTLRANFLQRWKDSDLDVVAVTSSAPLKEKATIAALFAESLARIGADVLLIEADVYRPGIGERFQLDLGIPGTREVLAGEAAFEDAVQPGWVDGLSVIASTADSAASDLLSQGLANLVERAASRYELIVLSGPTVVSPDDARTLASCANGVLLVVPAGAVKASITHALSTLEAVGTPAIGIVETRLGRFDDAHYPLPSRADSTS